MAIDSFRGEYQFLSSMYRLKNGLLVLPEDVLVDSVEQGYQTEKFLGAVARQAVLEARGPHDSKKIAHDLERGGEPKRPDWDEVKVDIMRGFVEQKYRRNPQLKRLLLATGKEEIIEGNRWNDNFWGQSPPGNPKGLNWLGNIHMDFRDEFRGRKPKISERRKPLHLT